MRVSTWSPILFALAAVLPARAFAQQDLGYASEDWDPIILLEPSIYAILALSLWMFLFRWEISAYLSSRVGRSHVRTPPR